MWSHRKLALQAQVCELRVSVVMCDIDQNVCALAASCCLVCLPEQSQVVVMMMHMPVLRLACLPCACTRFSASVVTIKHWPFLYRILPRICQLLFSLQLSGQVWKNVYSLKSVQA